MVGLRRAAPGFTEQEWQYSLHERTKGLQGLQRGSVQVQVHPDWRAQLLLEQVREAESEQALDRLRLLRGEGKQRQVYVLSNVPLNVTVDC